MNLADSVTKLHFKLYSLVSQNYFFGGFLSLPQEKWPVTYLKDLKLGTFRQFDDLLSRYSTYMDRFTGPKLIHQQEDKIKHDTGPNRHNNRQPYVTSCFLHCQID